MSRTRGLLNRVLSVLRSLAPFSYLKSGNQAMGEMASARHMFANSNLLIVLNRKAFERQTQFQIRPPSISVAVSILAQGHSIQEDVKFGVPSARRVDPLGKRRAEDRGK